MTDSSDLINRIKCFVELQEEIYAPVGKLEAQQQAATPASSQDKGVLKKEEIAAKESAENIEENTDPNYPSPEMIKSLKDCTTLEELRTLCETADILKTDLPDTKLVFGKGHPQADLMIVGEAPGAKEDALGEPFVGASGNLLTKILEAIKIDRSDVFIANILKHRPPENRNPTAEERRRSLPFLEQQIDIIKPKIILCLGLVSAQTLLESSSPLKDLRGKFHPYRGDYELMVTYHPAALLRNKHLKRDTWEDVQKLRARYDELGGNPAFAPY